MQPLSLGRKPCQNGIVSLGFPTVWPSSRGHLHYDRLRAEAAARSQSYRVPLSVEEWELRAKTLKAELSRRLLIDEEVSAEFPLDLQFHREVRCAGYKIVPISFLTHPGIRMTANLYIPEGKGPFPAILNPHGHNSRGKAYPRFQERGHVLAQNGFVVLCVDAPGSGERGDRERHHEYHGGLRGAGLFLTGDSLLGWQVRDNRRALDVLQSLPFVDGQRLGVTGASGGGNQTMWLAALDERVKAVVPVVSVGSFEAYVGRCNCVCETLPGGLLLAEEWEILGLIAPRPLLVINSIHDQPAFAVSAMSGTCRATQELYELMGARAAFDNRLIDLPHGYWPPMLAAMLGWMRYWLQGEGSATPAQLPPLNRSLEAELFCYDPGERPAECSNIENKRSLLQAFHKKRVTQQKCGRAELAERIAWKQPIRPSFLAVPSTVPDVEASIITSPRRIPLPVISTLMEEGLPTTEIRLILSPSGKDSRFVRSQWQKAVAAGARAISFDLPATGELKWENEDAFGAFHDAARAAIWLGYSLPGEWAEAIASVVRAVNERYPVAPLRIIAERETVLATLLAMAIDKELVADIEEHDCPESLSEIYEQTSGSLAWIVPGLWEWGDLCDLRALHRQGSTVDLAQPAVSIP